jgi:hypothetical protein
MEPVSLIILGALLEKGSGKFADKIWDSGEKWLDTFYKNHRPKALEKAKDNTISFLDELVKRVEILEKENRLSSEVISNTQEDPDFGVTLQKAIIAASQTEEKEKHKILARLISERLTVDSTSVFSLASKMACDSISYATSNQLRLLAFLVNLHGIRPENFHNSNLEGDKFQEYVENWLDKSLNPYLNLNIGKQDLNHLESISCIRQSNLGFMRLDDLFSTDKNKFSVEKLKNLELKEKLNSYWHEQRLMVAQLNTVGTIIGVIVSDYVANTKTVFKDWE